MSRRPKPKDGLTAGQRVALYEAELEEKRKKMLGEDYAGDKNAVSDVKNVEGTGSSADETVKSEKIVKKALQKPQYATVNVDLALKIGEVKPLHSMCNGPVSYGADVSSLFREIGVPYVRFDCTDSAVSAYAVDISRIFKDFGADPTDPDSYDFAVTDKYVEAAYLAGAKVMFRLGESIDPFASHKTPLIYDAPDILARACVNIIRHYNERWASGYEFGIEYFEIAGPVFDGDDGFERYKRLADSLKLYDEDIKIGGMGLDLFSGRARELLRFCKKSRAPLDFLTVDCFATDVERAAEEIGRLSALMLNLGYNDCEIVIGKWGYADEPSRVLTERDKGALKKLLEEQRGVSGAAYVAAMLLRLQDVEGLKTACFFDAQPMISQFCAIADAFGEPRKPYYSFKAFGELYRAGCRVYSESLQTDGMAHTGVYACAAVSDSGEAYILLASFKGCGVIDLRLDGIPDDLYSADIYMLDGVKDMSLADTVPLSGMKKRILLNVSEYGVVLVKLY